MMSFLFTLFKSLFTLLGFSLIYVLGFLPWRWQKKFAYLLSYAVRCSSRWQVILHNYELCFPEWDEKQRLQQAKKQCFYFACMPLIMFNNLHRAKIITSQVKRVKGIEYLQDLQAQGKGCLILGYHGTAMDVANRYLSQYFDIALVYQKGEDFLSNYLMLKIRQRLNPTLIDKKRVISIIRRLNQGGFLWYAADQSHGGSMKKKIDFFGHQVDTVTGWDRILKSCNNVGFCLSSYYYENGGYVINIHPPFENYQAMDSVQLAQCYMNFIENQARIHPAQYYWVHRRFKCK